MLNESIPTESARTASSTVLRMTTSPASSRPDSSTVTYAGVSNPNSNSIMCVPVSLDEIAGVDWKGDAGDLAALVRGEEQDGFRDVHGFRPGVGARPAYKSHRPVPRPI